MTAGKYCNREVVITGPDTTITEAASLMRLHHVGDLVVVEKQNEKNLPVGIVTDRDLVIEVLAQQVPPDSLTVRDIMSTNLATVIENESLQETLRLMRDRGIRRIPVVNSYGSLEGILCADDIIELISEATNDLVKLIRHEQTSEQKQHS